MPFKSQTYFLGIREHHNTFLFEETSFIKEFVFLKNSPLHYYADPFLFSINGIHYIFCERINKITHKGSIVYTIINKSNRQRFFKLSNEKFHMSFPFVFTKNNCVYLIPETSEDSTVSLYYFDVFPSKISKAKVLMNNSKMVDSVLFHNYLFTYSISNKKETRFQIYNCSDDLNVENLLFDYIDFECNKRGAGCVFEYKNSFIYPTQIGKPSYGYGILFNYVKFNNKMAPTLTPFKSINAIDVSRHFGKQVNGIHTYNRDDVYEVVDFDISIFSFLGLIGKIVRKIRKIFRNEEKGN